jgi:hypothetical protein
MWSRVVKPPGCWAYTGGSGNRKRKEVTVEAKTSLVRI